jgi:hypothetical protein
MKILKFIKKAPKIGAFLFQYMQLKETFTATNLIMKQPTNGTVILANKHGIPKTN